MLYDVHCQDAIGRGTTITVSADTDERACDAALVDLNSWRAVRAIRCEHRISSQRTTASIEGETKTVAAGPPATGHEFETASLNEVEEQAVTQEQFGLIHRPTLRELISKHRGARGAVGEALLRAEQNR